MRAIDCAALRETTRSRSGFPEYSVSKLCNVLYARELAERLRGRGTYALHPGVIASDIWRRLPWLVQKAMMLFMRSNEDGAHVDLQFDLRGGRARDGTLL